MNALDLKRIILVLISLPKHFLEFNVSSIILHNCLMIIKGIKVDAIEYYSAIKKKRHYFLAKVCVVRAMRFPLVMCGCQSWTIKMAVCVLVTQACLTLCDPMDCSLLDSSVHGIFQAIILEWVAISFSRGSSRPRDRTHVSCVSCIACGFFTT